MKTITNIARVEPVTQKATPAGVFFLIACACGLIVANIYYAQPLAGPISQALGLRPEAAGLIVTLTQIGYGAGLLLIVPLADFFDNRRLILAVVGIGVLALLGASLSANAPEFLLSALFIGIGSVAVQILVPYAAHLAPEETRGKIVGNVASGLMIGVMMARPIASFITSIGSWRIVFVLSAVAMVLISLTLYRFLPPRVPDARLRYTQMLASMGKIAVSTPILQRRAFYQACLFGGFSLFWTTSPLLLAGPRYGLSQGGIALFGLAGVAGALAAPIAGRLADRGWTRQATVLATAAAGLAFVVTRFAAALPSGGLALFVIAAILLDLGVQANVVLGQRAIFSLDPELRGRLNGLYMATFFSAGAIGSAVGAWAYAVGGWNLASWIGLALPLAALVFALGEMNWKRARHSQ